MTASDITPATGVVPTIKNIIRLCKFAHGKKVEAQPDDTQPGQLKVTNEAGQVNYFNDRIVNMYNQSRTQSLMSRVTSSGVKPRRLGRGYKPRKPGADFI